jgi:hypothetical protein
MEKEEISAKLKELAKGIADITNEIMTTEDCAACLIVMEITNVMGVCGVTLDVKHSERGGKEKVLDAIKNLRDAIGDPTQFSHKDEPDEPVAPPSEMVETLLKELREKKDQS